MTFCRFQAGQIRRVAQVRILPGSSGGAAAGPKQAVTLYYATKLASCQVQGLQGLAMNCCEEKIHHKDHRGSQRKITEKSFVLAQDAMGDCWWTELEISSVAALWEPLCTPW